MKRVCPKRHTSCDEFSPRFVRSSGKWLGDWNIPIPLVGPHPLHAHKRISRRWKRTWACSIEREIRDFPSLCWIFCTGTTLRMTQPFRKLQKNVHIHLQGSVDILMLSSPTRRVTLWHILNIISLLKKHLTSLFPLVSLMLSSLTSSKFCSSLTRCLYDALQIAQSFDLL